MVVLDKQFDHHHGTKPRSCGRLRDESWQAGKSVERRTADILSVRSPRDTSISLNTSCANEIIYCSYRLDPESQLNYVRNRTYNAVLVRWIQRDPIGYAGGVNLYGYVGGEAAEKADANGLGGRTLPPKPGPDGYPVYDGAGGWSPVPGDGGSIWYYTGQRGKEVVGYSNTKWAKFGDQCVKLGNPVYAPAALVATGNNTNWWEPVVPSQVIGTAGGAAGTAIGPEGTLGGFAIGFAIGTAIGLITGYVFQGSPYQTQWIRISGPVETGAEIEVVPGSQFTPGPGCPCESGGG